MASEHFKKALELARFNQNRKPQRSRKPRTTSHPTIDRETASDFTAISYHETRIHTVDESVLRENRVIAGFPDDPRSIPFRILRTQVLHKLQENDWNTLAITAPHSGAGKSFIAVNLAVSMSLLTNQTILLVDLDLRNPSIHRYFDFQPEYGVYDHIVNKVPLENILINPGIPRLTILPGSTPTSSSSELLSTKNARLMMDEIKERYSQRIIIYDLPPLLGIDDVMVVQPKIDTTMLVVEANRTTAAELEKSLEILNENSLIGTVFNKSDETDTNTYGY